MDRTTNKLETLETEGTLDVFHGVYRLTKDPDSPEFDRHGEWTGRGRMPTVAEALAAEDYADEVLVAYMMEVDAMDAARGWEEVDESPDDAGREDEWTEWDAMEEDDRLFFATR